VSCPPVARVAPATVASSCLLLARRRSPHIVPGFRAVSLPALVAAAVAVTDGGAVASAAPLEARRTPR
jgi:hypothetical protein